MEPVLLWSIGQFVAFVLLLRYMQVQVRDNKQGLETLVKDSYTKTETNERIDLKLEPIKVGIGHVQDDLKEVKAMLNRLLDEKNK